MRATIVCIVILWLIGCSDVTEPTVIPATPTTAPTYTSTPLPTHTPTPVPKLGVIPIPVPTFEIPETPRDWQIRANKARRAMELLNSIPTPTPVVEYYDNILDLITVLETDPSLAERLLGRVNATVTTVYSKEYPDDSRREDYGLVSEWRMYGRMSRPLRFVVSLSTA